MATFADNLKRIRTSRKNPKMTQVSLANESGLTQPAISRYETGEDIPELPALLKLLTGLRVPFEALVEGLDVRFDFAYQELRASITLQTEPQPPAQQERSLHIGVTPPDLDNGEEVDPTHPSSRLIRVGEEIIAVARDLRTWRPPAMARGGGSDVPEGIGTAHAATRRDVAQKPLPKRPASKR